MASIGKVSAVFSASTSGLKAGVSEASSQFKKLGNDVDTLRSRMGTLVAIQGAQLFSSLANAVSSVAGSFLSMARGEAEAIDRMSKLAARLGMTYGELAGLKLAGDLAGVSMDAIANAATRADVAFVQASQGSALARGALEGVGLSVEELQNKSPAERFQMIADAIAALPTPAERARAAIRLFGRSGVELLPMLQRSATGINTAMAGAAASVESMAGTTAAAGDSAAGMAAGIDLSVISARSLANATALVDQSLAAAASGSQAARDSFAKIGLSAEELAAKRPDERFRMIATAISQLPSASQRASAAIEIFGLSGASLLPAFEGATGAIQRATDQASMFGLALTSAQASDVESMNDAFTLAGASIQGIVQQVTAYLAPAIQGVVDTFTTLVGSVGGANIGKFIGDGIIAGAEFLAAIADSVISGLSGVWQYVSTVGSYWSTIWEIGSRVAAALSGVFNVGKLVLGAGALGIGMVVQGLATVAQKIGQYLGFDTSTIDAVVAGAQAFNASVNAGMEEAASQAARDFATVINGSDNVPQAPQAPGAFSTMLADAVDRANASRAATEPPQQITPPPQEAVKITASTEAVKATDSRSKEGVAEMFRLMRGTGEQVQEQQLGVLEQIRDAVSSADPEELYTLAGA